MPTAVRKMKQDLRDLSSALRELRESEGLSRWALVTLMRAKSGLNKRTVEAVLDDLESLIDEAFEEDAEKSGGN